MTKQLAAYKETVSQYSIQCGDLEDRLNELQLDKSNVEKKITQLEMAMSNKTGEIKLLQIELDEVRMNSGHLEEENDLLRKKNEEYSELLATHANITKDEEILELKSHNKSLNNKIQSISRQKMKLEGEITTLTDTNRTLEQSVAEAEGKMQKLQARLDLLENEKQSSLCNGKESVSSDTTDYHPAFEKLSDGMMKNGVSLFGELDEQFIQLQKQFKDLVTSCNCSASLPYRDKFPFNNNLKKRVEMNKPSVNKKPFQHIFDKIYATLKETTIVADRLLLQTTMDTIDAENITEGVVS